MTPFSQDNLQEGYRGYYKYEYRGGYIFGAIKYEIVKRDDNLLVIKSLNEHRVKPDRYRFYVESALVLDKYQYPMEFSSVSTKHDKNGKQIDKRETEISFSDNKAFIRLTENSRTREYIKDLPENRLAILGWFEMPFLVWAASKWTPEMKGSKGKLFRWDRHAPDFSNIRIVDAEDLTIKIGDKDYECQVYTFEGASEKVGSRHYQVCFRNGEFIAWKQWEYVIFLIEDYSTMTDFKFPK